MASVGKSESAGKDRRHAWPVQVSGLGDQEGDIFIYIKINTLG
jgi:hypothetical protein